MALAADLGQSMVPPAVVPVAAGGPSMIVSGWLGGVALQTDDEDFVQDFIFAGGGDARLEFDLGARWSGQLEVAGAAHDEPDNDGDPGAYHIIGGAHLFDRFDGGAWGVFLAGTYTRTADTDETISHIVGGGEYARWSGRMLYGAQLGGHATIGGDPDNTWDAGAFATLSARYFKTDDVVWGGKLALGGLGDFDGDENALWAQWGVDYEHRLSGTPISFTAAYQGDLLKEIGDGDWEDNLINHTLKAGIRVAFGGSSETAYAAAANGAATFALPDLSMPLAYADDLW
jgi:hypothetical protein